MGDRGTIGLRRPLSARLVRVDELRERAAARAIGVRGLTNGGDAQRVPDRHRRGDRHRIRVGTIDDEAKASRAGWRSLARQTPDEVSGRSAHRDLERLRRGRVAQREVVSDREIGELAGCERELVAMRSTRRPGRNIAFDRQAGLQRRRRIGDASVAGRGQHDTRAGNGDGHAQSAATGWHHESG